MLVTIVLDGALADVRAIVMVNVKIHLEVKLLNLLVRMFKFI
jgi:hypothetical protein